MTIRVLLPIGVQDVMVSQFSRVMCTMTIDYRIRSLGTFGNPQGLSGLAPIDAAPYMCLSSWSIIWAHGAPVSGRMHNELHTLRRP